MLAEIFKDNLILFGMLDKDALSTYNKNVGGTFQNQFCLDCLLKTSWKQVDFKTSPSAYNKNDGRTFQTQVCLEIREPSIHLQLKCWQKFTKTIFLSINIHAFSLPAQKFSVGMKWTIL